LVQGSILIIEEGTPDGDDWRQLIIELPPSTFDFNGVQSFPKPIWQTREADILYPFPVLGSLDCDPAVDKSLAARINNVWICVDINDPELLPPVRRKRASTGRVNPPTCTEDLATPVFDALNSDWVCGPALGVFQSPTFPDHPECFDGDIIAWNNDKQWFECLSPSKITFMSTISKTDLRWQTPSTTRSIGALASSGQVRSGQYNQFKYTLYVFTANTDTLANDQTSPPQTINSGGATWSAFTITTNFVEIIANTGTPDDDNYNYYPVWPGSSSSWKSTLAAKLPGGAVFLGSVLVFRPAKVTFPANGNNVVTYFQFAGSGTNYDFTYDGHLANLNTTTPTTLSSDAFAVVGFPSPGVKLDAKDFPVVEVETSPGDWHIGKTTSPTTTIYDPNLLVTITMWLSYNNPSGF